MLIDTPLFQLKHLTFEYTSFHKFSARDSVFRSMPNNEKFDRDNRYEMVLFINSLQALWNLYNIEDCQKMEYLIKAKMPEKVETQLEIADWLVINWNTFDLPQFAKAV